MEPAEGLLLGSGAAVLLIQPRAMGDALLTTPLIRALKSNYPSCDIDFLAESLPARLLRFNPHLREIFIAPQRGSQPWRYAPLLTRLIALRYRLAVDLISTPGSALLAYLTRAHVRVGYRLRGRSWAYTHPVPRRVEPIYNPATKFDLVAMLGLQPDNLSLDLVISDHIQNRSDKIWSELSLNPKTTVIGLAPWSKREWRRWSLDAWGEFIKSASIEQNITWLLFAGANERAELAGIERLNSARVVWASQSDILETAALIGRCKLLIGVDNGLKHIAVALGVPTLTIYTGSNPVVWNPPGMSIHRALVPKREPLTAEELMIHLDGVLTGGRA